MCGRKNWKESSRIFMDGFCSLAVCVRGSVMMDELCFLALCVCDDKYDYLDCVCVCLCVRER